LSPEQEQQQLHWPLEQEQQLLAPWSSEQQHCTSWALELKHPKPPVPFEQQGPFSTFEQWQQSLWSQEQQLLPPWPKEQELPWPLDDPDQPSWFSDYPQQPPVPAEQLQQQPYRPEMQAEEQRQQLQGDASLERISVSQANSSPLLGGVSFQSTPPHHKALASPELSPIYSCFDFKQTSAEEYPLAIQRWLEEES
jgi:hypothetical protein